MPWWARLGDARQAPGSEGNSSVTTNSRVLLANGLRRLLMLSLCVSLVGGGPAAQASQDSPAPLAPTSAPNPPDVKIARQGSAAVLTWQHPDSTVATYQIWRSQNPYFDPNAGEGTLIDSYSFSLGPYGTFTVFNYLDNGSCGYYLAPLSAPKTCRYPQTPTVTAIGDVSHNYFWAVRAGNSAGEFDFGNRVGEFDFALVPGS